MSVPHVGIGSEKWVVKNARFLFRRVSLVESMLSCAAQNAWLDKTITNKKT